MSIHDFEKEQSRLCRDKDIREAWLTTSAATRTSRYYRKSPQYRNQISIVNGRKAGSDINLYKLFTEQCFNLLRPGGHAASSSPPASTPTWDQTAPHHALEQTQITGLFCFENRRTIFENVDCRFRLVVLTFTRGGSTRSSRLRSCGTTCRTRPLPGARLHRYLRRSGHASRPIHCPLWSSITTST